MSSMKADQQMFGPAEWCCTPCCSAGTPLMNARETLQTRGSMRNIGSSFLLRGFKLETLSKLSLMKAYSIVQVLCCCSVQHLPLTTFRRVWDCRCSCLLHVNNQDTQASSLGNFLSCKALVCWKSGDLFAIAVCSTPASDTHVQCHWQLHSANLACTAFPKL